MTPLEDLKKNLDQVKELNPILMSSLQFADISPNFEQIEKLSTSGLLFVLSNPSVDTELKIFCSEMLVKQGRISADMLSEAYQLSSFDEKEIQKAESLYKSLSILSILFLRLLRFLSDIFFNHIFFQNNP